MPILVRPTPDERLADLERRVAELEKRAS